MDNKTEQKPIPASVVGALAEEFNRTHWTILRWIDKHDDRLTSDRAKNVFKKLNFSFSEEESIAA